LGVVPLQAQNAKTSNVKDYLKKLPLKAFSLTLSSKASSGLELSENEVGFHFASKKRFFTCSRSLLKRPSKGVTAKLRIWTFAGSWHWLDLPDWVLEAASVTLVADGELGWRVEPIASR